MKCRKISILGLLFCCFFIYEGKAQKKILKKYWVAFTDKNDSPYSIFHPHEFLSLRAIQRRERNHIPIEENDLPVNPRYIQALQKEGTQIHNKSKWLNGATIISDTNTVKQVAKLPFVDTVIYVGSHIRKKIFLKQTNKERDQIQDYERMDNPYGNGFRQIELMRGEALHQMGFEGDGKIVAVLDGGFTNVDIMPFFDTLFEKHKIIPGWDFVDGDDYVYESSSHGSTVLSVMGADLPGLLIGTGPEAQYVCVKTEDTRAEYLVEECNWIAGAEFADSLGADIINSSLGYTHFWDTTMNYNYQQLDGKTSRATLAADIAFTKGLLVVNSAGNSGSDAWKYVGVPADGEHVLAIGATLDSGLKASFSSYGPTADGRIKPNVSAMGQFITVGSIYSYNTQPSNGTSFAAPIVSGMAASLWGAYPEKSNQEIFDAIQQSGDQFDEPDNKLGYGIPDFLKAYQILSGDAGALFNDASNEVAIIQNENAQSAEIILKNAIKSRVEVQVKNIYGQEIMKTSYVSIPNSYHQFEIDNLPDDQILILSIKVGDKIYRHQLKTKRKVKERQVP